MARLRCLGAVLCAALAIPHLASAQAYRVGDNANFGGTPQILYPDVAYDPVNKRYFEVTTAYSHTVIEGRFVTPTAPASNSYDLSGTVTISTASFLNEYPRVTYSPHVAGGGGFLVTWHKGFSSGAILFAKVMGRIYSASGAALTDEFVVSTSTGATGSNSSHYGMGAPSAYSTGSQEFLVVWASTKYEVIGQRVSNTGAANGGNFLISQGGVGRYDRDPSVAYSPAVDKFYVGWGVFVDASLSGHAEGRLVQASTGALGSILPLDNAKGVSITSVAYNATADQFLFSWYHDDGVGYQYTYGSILSSSGAVVGPSVRVLSSLYSAYNALDVEFNQLAGEYLLVTHGNDSLSNGKEDFGVSIRADGTPYSNGFRVTVTNAAGGNYNPRLATSSDRKEWLVVTSTNFTQVSGQFLGSDSTGSGTPPPPSCTYSISPATISISAGAADGSIYVTTQPGCTWGAQASGSEIAFQNGSSRTGSGSLQFSVTANTSPSPRSSAATIGGQTFTVNQTGFVSCSYSINPSSVSIGSGADSGTIFVTAPAGCPWNASSHVGFISFGAGGGNGSAGLTFNVAQNTGGARSGTATIAGYTFTVNQSSACSFSLNPASVSIGNVGDTGTINVTTPAGCAWSAISGSRFLTFDNGGERSGPGTLNFTVTTNKAASSRTGNGSIGGLTFSVTQGPAAIDPGLQNLENERGDLTGDGKNDLLWQNTATGELALWALDGATVVGQGSLSYYIADKNWRVMGTGDFNSDGSPDFVFQHLTEGWVYVWYMNGVTRIDSGYLSIPKLLDPRWRIAGVGDFNSDGKPDIVWQHPTERWLALWLVNGTSVTSVALSPGQVLDANWKIAGVGDFNADGKSDLVWRHSGDGSLGLWVMDGQTRSAFWALQPGVVADQQWQIVGVSDINGDNISDLVWHHAAEGWVAVWYMNEDTRIEALSFNAVRGGTWSIVGAR